MSGTTQNLAGLLKLCKNLLFILKKNIPKTSRRTNRLTRNVGDCTCIVVFVAALAELVEWTLLP
jgi:hypothetical protein